MSFVGNGTGGGSGRGWRMPAAPYATEARSCASWPMKSMAGEIFEMMDDRGHPELPVLSATQDFGMIRRDDSGRYVGHDASNEVGYKRVIPGSFVVHLRSFQGEFALSPIEGITSSAYTVLTARYPSSQSDRFWKHWFMSPRFIHDLGTVTYGIRDGRSINAEEYMDTLQAYPSFEEQKLNGLTLDCLDSLITLHHREFSLPSCGIPILLVPSIRRESPCMHYRGE
jgi:type I restriction enzyme S subunit